MGFVPHGRWIPQPSLVSAIGKHGYDRGMNLTRIREGLDDARQPVLASWSHAPLPQSTSVSISGIQIDVIVTGETRGWLEDKLRSA